MSSSRLNAALAPTALTLGAGLLRFIDLGKPASIYFDETYYVNDAIAYLKHGVEEGFAVHPPVGKWLIAGGIALFGEDSPFGWRVAGAIAGTLLVLLTYLIGVRLFHRRGAAALAALLVAVDGLTFVQSRISMLDIFLALFVALGAWCLLRDRDAREVDGTGWWRFAAGVAFGLGIATKWSGVLALGAGIIVVFATDRVLSRRVRASSVDIDADDGDEVGEVGAVGDTEMVATVRTPPQGG